MIDLTEIKKLPDAEKLKIIDEIWESMEDSEQDDESNADPEVVKEMERRLDDLQTGKDPGYTWEQAKAILLSEIHTKR